jgi:hypothetical protein
VQIQERLRKITVFWTLIPWGKNMLPPSSRLKTKAAHSTEIAVNVLRTKTTSYPTKS